MRAFFSGNACWSPFLGRSKHLFLSMSDRGPAFHLKRSPLLRFSRLALVHITFFFCTGGFIHLFLSFQFLTMLEICPAIKLGFPPPLSACSAFPLFPGWLSFGSSRHPFPPSKQSPPPHTDHPPGFPPNPSPSQFKIFPPKKKKKKRHFPPRKACRFFSFPFPFENPPEASIFTAGRLRPPPFWFHLFRKYEIVPPKDVNLRPFPHCRDPKGFFPPFLTHEFPPLWTLTAFLHGPFFYAWPPSSWPPFALIFFSMWSAEKIDFMGGGGSDSSRPTAFLLCAPVTFSTFFFSPDAGASQDETPFSLKGRAPSLSSSDHTFPFFLL